MPGVVVGLPFGDARPHRQDRLGPSRAWHLGLLVDADHDRVLRRCQVQAHDVADLGFQLRVGGELEPLGPVRLQAELPPQPGDRVVADRDAPWPGAASPPAAGSTSASPPCACSDSGGGVTVAARISLTASSVSTVFGPPGRGASSSPASPSSAYCRRHLTTVGSVHPARSAICGPVSPSAASSTILARSATRAGAPGPGPAAPAPPGQHQAPSECARDSACAIVPHPERRLKRNTRQNTRWLSGLRR